MAMLLFVESMLWSIIGDVGFVVSSVVLATQALLSFHILTGKMETRPVFLELRVGHRVWRSRPELGVILHHERRDLFPYRKGDERTIGRALIGSGLPCWRASLIQERSFVRMIIGSLVQDRFGRSLSESNALALVRTAGDVGERRCVRGCSAGDASVDALLLD